MNLITVKSANHSKNSRKPTKIKFLIIHYTGMQSKRVSLDRLLNTRIKNKVSCHYFVERSGKIIQMVEDQKIAWHAGKSKWKNFINLNLNSIGIELENKGHQFGYQKFTNIQIKRLIFLILKLKKKYHITNSNILAHSDIAPLRKKDPGEKFPWKFLKKKGLGIWYPSLKYSKRVKKKNNIRNIFFKNLYKIGYRYFSIVKRSKNDKLIIKAFQRRYCQSKVDGLIDKKTLIISQYLASKANK